ncbi:MAG: prolyl oligopeptidase family serine peptidase, partial [Chlamydiia bacterium]
NYGGSSGFGRQYRNRLLGNWGVVDVQDCILAAQEMVKRGQAHQDQIVIRGSSSGGLTALIAVCVSKVFAAATSYYGVVDLERLALASHKFERYYLDGLIGPYPAAKATYIERSPLCNSSNIACPILLFHGTEDKVVPLSGSTRIFDVLQDKGILTKLFVFEKEGHGFRAASTIEKALNEELSFYRKVLGLV